jgi:hypothetical protein
MAEEKQHENSIVQIREYFERDAEPLRGGEFIAFWKSLTPEEKIEFMHADLSK